MTERGSPLAGVCALKNQIFFVNAVPLKHHYQCTLPIKKGTPRAAYWIIF